MPCSLFHWCGCDSLFTLSSHDYKQGQRQKRKNKRWDWKKLGTKQIKEQIKWKEVKIKRRKRRRRWWGEFKQENITVPPGKDLLLPHMLRDEAEQMFLGPQVTKHRSDCGTTPLLEDKSQETQWEQRRISHNRTQWLWKTARTDLWPLAEVKQCWFVDWKHWANIYFICKCTCMYIHICTEIYLYNILYIYVYISMYVYMYTYIYTCIWLKEDHNWLLQSQVWGTGGHLCSPSSGQVCWGQLYFSSEYNKNIIAEAKQHNRVTKLMSL